MLEDGADVEKVKLHPHLRYYYSSGARVGRSGYTLFEWIFEGRAIHELASLVGIPRFG